jgi:ankyrin repeat protein
MLQTLSACLQVNTDCDEFGNTALHMCVIHDQADMYDFLVDYCAASEAVRNHGGLTPLCLAAHMGKSDMLQHVYNRRRRAFYSFGKVCAVSSLQESGCPVCLGWNVELQGLSCWGRAWWLLCGCCNSVCPPVFPCCAFCSCRCVILVVHVGLPAGRRLRQYSAQVGLLFC